MFYRSVWPRPQNYEPKCGLLSLDYLLTIYFCRLKSVTFLPIPFFVFLYYLCGLLVWILDELKLYRQCMVFEFVVPELGFEIGVSQLKQISLCKLIEKIWARSKGILSPNSKILKKSLLFCMFAISLTSVCCKVWQCGINLNSALDNHALSHLKTQWHPSDRSSEIEFGMLPSQPCCDILWHFVKRWYHFLMRQGLFWFPPNKNQHLCIR